jgi:predicted phage terminase large subunit-like protein
LLSRLLACGNDSGTHDALIDVDYYALVDLLGEWFFYARDDQRFPVDADGAEWWRTWLLLGGRGSGKTRTGAEWVRSLVADAAAAGTAADLRIALVGETMRDARSVMIDGVSGILAVSAADADGPAFEASRQRLIWANGAIAQVFAADDPDGLRGPQFHAAWCDELAKWRRAEEAWDMLQMALRLGDNPRAVVTTTPRPLPLLRQLLTDPATVVSRMRTVDNKDYLAGSFLAEMQRRYAGTALGRQELDGEIIEDYAGALWRRDWIELLRLHDALPLEVATRMKRIVVAVDPPVTATATSDACGIVVAGLGEDGRGYVLADRTLQGREAHVWARAAITAWREFRADRIVAEVNQGGDLVAMVIRQIDAGVPFTGVHATRGKYVRAEPIAALYAEGRVVHVGHMKELEAQMLAFGAGGLQGGRSPDRLDALVWALTELMLEPKAAPSVRAL